nr:hypothetical protein [Tanacetum cinerariifolium]
EPVRFVRTSRFYYRGNRRRQFYRGHFDIFMTQLFGFNAATRSYNLCNFLKSLTAMAFSSSSLSEEVASSSLRTFLALRENYTPDTPHSDEESEPIEASETRTASPSDSTLPIARKVVRTQPTLSPGISAGVTEAMALSPSLFRKRGIEVLLILDTETKGDESKAQGTISESEESEDEGPGSKGEEAASEEKQQAVLVEDTATYKPLGLDTGWLDHVEDETLRLPTRPTWVDPEDGTVYIDIKFDAPPVQTPASPEWLFSSLPVSPASLTVPLPYSFTSDHPSSHHRTSRCIATTLLKGMGWDIIEFYDRSATVKALWQARYEDQREIHALRMQHDVDQREM